MPRKKVIFIKPHVLRMMICSTNSMTKKMLTYTRHQQSRKTLITTLRLITTKEKNITLHLKITQMNIPHLVLARTCNHRTACTIKKRNRTLKKILLKFQTRSTLTPKTINLIQGISTGHSENLEFLIWVIHSVQPLIERTPILM